MSDLPPLDTLDGEGAAPDMTAGEFALGLLEGGERAAVLRRVLAEPGFAREVENWRVHLSPLFDLWPAMTAPDIFGRVERSLDGPAGTTITALPARRSSKLWPSLAALSSIAAAGLLVVLFTQPVAVPPAPQPHATAPVMIAPTLVASITPTAKGTPSAKGTPVTAVYDARAGAIRLTEANLADAHRIAQLWVIPAGGTPHSLGLLREHGGTALALSHENRARLIAGAVLAVSLEPVGGSPTGLPTGPVVATGALSQV